jgi:hypothetical protein
MRPEWGKCVRALMEKPKRKRPFGRPRCAWNDIKVDLKEV